MRNLKRALGLAGAGAFALAAPAFAQESAKDEKLSFRFEGKLGAEYSSNVSVSDLDTSTGEGDWAVLANALVEATLIPVEKLTLRAGYDFSQSFHQEFDAFDLTISRPYAEIAYDFDAVTVGVLGNWASAALDGEDYLTYTQVQPYISKQFGNSLFLRLAYAATEKDFQDPANNARDADQTSIQGDAYIFLDGVTRYFIVGAKATEEDARQPALVTDPDFDWSGAGGRVRFVQRFDALGREMTFRIGADYEVRDYDNTTSLPAPLNDTRSDKRLVFDTSLDIPFGDRVFSEISYNLQAANYDEHVASIKVGFKY
jgi:hypothetical protein